MKNVLKIIALLSLIVNVYYYAVLTYISLAYNSHGDRTDQYPTYFGHIPATNTLLFLVLFTLLSIIIVGLKDVFPHRMRVLFSAVQALAFALYLWQLM